MQNEIYVEGITIEEYKSFRLSFDCRTPELRDRVSRLDSKIVLLGGEPGADHEALVLARFDSQKRTRSELYERLISAILGVPGATPTEAEHWMAVAWTASQRSSSIRVKVGAALVSAGSLIAIGANEVPVRGGGLAWASDDPDMRDFATLSDNGPTRRGMVRKLMTGALADSGMSPSNVAAIIASEAGQLITGLLDVERALHAEVAAVADAAKRGVSTQGATLYCTHRPCYRCQRVLTAAGIKSVLFDLEYDSSIGGVLGEQLSSPIQIEKIHGIRWNVLATIGATLA